MKNIFHKISGHDNKGFSLAEELSALVIGAMILVSVLGIYSRAENSAASIMWRLDSSRLPNEVFERITEDIDRIITPGSDTKIIIANKFERGFPTSRMTILKTYYDSANKPQTFEQIIWQNRYDFNSDANGLVLYRSHGGIAMEDKLLDESKEDWQRELFVPVCEGVTFFKIQVLQGENLVDNWNGDTLPLGIVVTISFGSLFENPNKTLDVPEEEKIKWTIAVNKTRKISFALAERTEKEENDVNDVNTPAIDKGKSGGKDSNEAAGGKKINSRKL